MNSRIFGADLPLESNPADVALYGVRHSLGEKLENNFLGVFVKIQLHPFNH